MKKLLMLALVTALALSLLTSCKLSIGGGEKDPSDNSGATAAPSAELTLEALKKAVQDLGYEVRDDYMSAFSATIEPQAGFTATYTSTGVYDIPFFEFRDNAEALAYKAENDAPDDMFPIEHIVLGKFAAEYSSLSEASGAECKKFVEDVFKKAGGGAPVNNNNNGGDNTAKIAPADTNDNAAEPNQIDIGGNADTNDANDLSLTMAALIAAAKNTGYEVDESWFSPGKLSDWVSKPTDGFFVYFTPESGSFQLSFMEFENEADAQAYKADNEKDNDQELFPNFFIVHGRFLAYMSKGFGDDTDRSIQDFLNGIFEYALANPVEDDGSRKRGGNTPSGAAVGKTQSEVEAVLTDYSISIAVDAPALFKEPYHMKQMRNDKGVFFEMTGDFNDLAYADFATHKAYELYAETKTGVVFNFDDDQAGMLKSFPFYIAQYLFRHTMYDGFEKTGSEKILGRDAAVYTVTSGGGLKLWIDDEYGFTLKFEETDSADNTIKMEVTEFTVGGVTLDGLINLNDYEIEEQ